MGVKSLLFVACLSLPIVAVADQLNVKLGLWEVTSTTHTSGMPPLPKAMLDQMTPAQRAQMPSSRKPKAARRRS
jgi:hypothetical protein